MNSVIKVHVQDGQWITQSSDTVPEDKQLCIVVFAYGSQSPHIVQYRSPDYLCDCYQDGYFLNLEDRFNREDAEESLAGWNPTFSSFRTVKYWRPLGLPEKEDIRIKEKIESWMR